MTHIRIGSSVLLKKPYGVHRVGFVVDVYGMISATGLKCTKWIVRFPHSRTKSKTVDVAFELEDFETWF